MKIISFSRINPFSIALLVSFLVSGKVYADPTVELLILNATGPSGEIIIVAGDDVEVGFNVILDSENGLKKDDHLELVNLADNTVVSSKKRGRGTSGSVILKIKKNTIGGQFYVRYRVHPEHTEIARVSHPGDPNSIPLVVIEEPTLAELNLRVTALEATDPVPGPQGDPGPQGPIGADGSDGVQGPAGATGAQGAQGVAGAVGATGPAGTDGVDGIDGAQGSQGAAGSDGADGATGLAGQNGIDGINGADGAPGPQGPPGVAGVDGTDGAGGAQGPQGITGSDGADGVTGLAGEDGIDGINGADGSQGPQGIAGADGVDGADGMQGPQGIAGLDGADGATGAEGPTGPTGPAGVDTLGSLSCTQGQIARWNDTGLIWECSNEQVNNDAPDPQIQQDYRDLLIASNASAYVFVTSQAFSGNLGGVEGADRICNELASDASLPGEYKVWLASSVYNAGTAAYDLEEHTPNGDFVQATNAYILPNGSLVATNWTSLVDGILEGPIDHNENGIQVIELSENPLPYVSEGGSTNIGFFNAQPPFVWSNATQFGTYDNGITKRNCNDWHSSSPSKYAKIGVTNLTSSAWAATDSMNCSNKFRLFCFGQ